MSRLTILGLTAVFVVASLATPSRAKADCAIMSGLGWGSLAGLVGGSITGYLLASSAAKDAASQNKATAGSADEAGTLGGGLGAVFGGLAGSFIGGALGLGTGLVMCVVENRDDVPTYATNDFVPVVNRDPLVLAGSSTLVDKIAAVTARQPSILFREATLLDPDTLPTF